MIEKVIIDFLGKNLSVPVFAEEPEEETKRYVVIEKVGGYKEEHINHASIAIKSYASSMSEAALLNGEVKKTMEDLIVLDDVVSVDLTRDYNFTDTTKKKYRYQAIFDLVFY